MPEELPSAAEPTPSSTETPAGPTLVIDDRRSDLCLAALVLVLAGLLAATPIDDPDFWWHLKSGQLVCQTGQVPMTDPFGLTTADRPWINLSWLWDVGLYQIYQAAGPVALTLVKIALAVLVALLLLNFRAPGATLWWGAVVTAVTLGPLSLRFLMRPEMVSLVFLAVVLLILYRFNRQRGTAWILLLPLVQVAWVNVHSLFILGLLALLAMVVGAWVHLAVHGPGPERPSPRWAAGLTAVFVVCLAVSFVNPFVERGVLFPVSDLLEKLTDVEYSEHVEELQVPWRDPALLTPTHWLLVGLVVAAALSFFINLARFNLGWFLTFAALAALGWNQRNMAFAALGAGAALSTNLSEWGVAVFGVAPATRGPWLWYGQAGRVLTLVGLLAAAVTSVSGRLPVGSLHGRYMGLGLAADTYCNEAARFLRETRLPGNPFTMKWSQAAVLIWENAPARKVFFDGRLELRDRQEKARYEGLRRAILYDWRQESDIPADVRPAVKGRVIPWGRPFQEHDITHVLVWLAPPSPMYNTLATLARSKHWELVYLDAVCAVFVVRDRVPEYAARYALRLDQAEYADAPAAAESAPAAPRSAGEEVWQSRRDRLLAVPDPLFEVRAPTALERFWQTRPERLGGDIWLGQHYLRLGHPLLAVRAIRRGLRESPNSAEGYAALAWAYLNLRAREMAVMASAMGEPARPEAPSDPARQALWRAIQDISTFRLRQAAFAMHRGLSCQPRQGDVLARLHMLACEIYMASGFNDLLLEHAQAYLDVTAPRAGSDVPERGLAVPATRPTVAGRTPAPPTQPSAPVPPADQPALEARRLRELALLQVERLQGPVEQIRRNVAELVRTGRRPEEAAAAAAAEPNGCMGEAIRLLEEARSQGRITLQGARQLAGYLLMVGRADEADAILQRVLERLRGLPGATSELAFELSTIHLLQGRYPDAAAVQDPHSLEVVFQICRRHREALTSLMRGLPVVAINELYDQTWDINALALWHYWMGLTKMEWGRMTQAAKAFVEAVRIEPQAVYVPLVRQYNRLIGEAAAAGVSVRGPQS